MTRLINLSSSQHTRTYRVIFAVLILINLSYIGYAFATNPLEAQAGVEENIPDAEPAEGITVIAAHGFEFTRTVNHLIAFRPNGSVLYYDDKYENYHDVDPSPEGRLTVLYIAEDRRTGLDCGGIEECWLNIIERVNLSTGERTRLFTRVRPGNVNNDPRWHDVDRVDENRILVGDITQDRVFIYNHATGLTEWSWSAQSAYPVTGGGDYPKEWTHLNDVELLSDGRIMTNLRNQDSVVFIDREEGIQSNQTLGCEDCHDIIYEAHNPDYIPAEDGGPAVVVADSENDRVVEYQRKAGGWVRTWHWQDSRTNWPRDADRLPNGHTLIADSNGDRVLEVDRDGDIVWQYTISSPYDVERLETGDESSGGPSAERAGLSSRYYDGETASRDRITIQIRRFVVQNIIPSRIWHGITFVSPDWMGFYGIMNSFSAIFLALVWGGIEIYRSPYELQKPIRKRRV